MEKKQKKGTPLWKALLLEHRLPHRFEWIKHAVFVNPLYYPKILLNLDYRSMNKLESSKTNINNKIVDSLILQLYGPRFLQDIFEICKKIDIKPFLVFGTLLGHYRDGGFIEHDTDIDLGLLENDFLSEQEKMMAWVDMGTDAELEKEIVKRIKNRIDRM